LLLVDDEPNIRLTLGAILEMRGFAVTTAGTVEEALAAIQRQTYDVLLSDLNIGEPYDGFTVASATRRLHPQVATVMITGYPAFDAALESIRQQVDDYLVKPTDVDELVDRIEEKLRSPRRTSPNQRKRPVEIIQENIDALIERWLNVIEADAELTELGVSAAARTGHLPQYLTALTTQIETNEKQAGKMAMEAASQHGRQRRSMGYSVRLLVRETRLLKTVIYEMLQEHLLEIKVSQLIAEIIAFSVSITEQLEISITAFQDDIPYVRAS